MLLVKGSGCRSLSTKRVGAHLLKESWAFQVVHVWFLRLILTELWHTRPCPDPVYAKGFGV